MTNGPKELQSRFRQLKGEKNLLKVGHINIDGLLSKISKINVIIQESDQDILSITETHLSAAINDENDMQVAETNDKLESNIEAVWEELVLHLKRALIGTKFSDRNKARTSDISDQKSILSDTLVVKMSDHFK